MNKRDVLKTLKDRYIWGKFYTPPTWRGILYH